MIEACEDLDLSQGSLAVRLVLEGTDLLDSYLCSAFPKGVCRTTAGVKQKQNKTKQKQC